jgi:hypothetical protein
MPRADNDFLDGLEPSKKSRKRAIKYWPKGHKLCKNCGCDSERRDYGGNGYCYRCYRLTRRLEKVKGWDPAYREALKRAYGFTDEEYKIWQDECIDQLEGRLAWLRGREKRYRGDVEGIDIEYQLGRILHLIRPEADYPRDATIIDHSFSEKQLVLIYHLLDLIEEAVPWEGPRRHSTIEYWKIWDKISERRLRSGIQSEH